MAEDLEEPKTATVPVECSTEATDERLVALVDGSMVEASRLSGRWLTCRPGCNECCIGPFAITMLDAERLRRGLRELERRDPSRAAAVKLRALAAVAIMQDYFPGDPSQGILRDDEEAEDRFCERFGSFPCPVLDPVSGRCDLYANRPISCRTFGPPVVVGGQSLPPCHLCFVGAPPSEIARCRVEPDPACTEDDLLQRIEQKGRLKGATTAAFALAIHL